MTVKVTPIEMICIGDYHNSIFKINWLSKKVDLDKKSVIILVSNKLNISTSSYSD